MWLVFISTYPYILQKKKKENIIFPFKTHRFIVNLDRGVRMLSLPALTPPAIVTSDSLVMSVTQPFCHPLNIAGA